MSESSISAFDQGTSTSVKVHSVSQRAIYKEKRKILQPVEFAALIGRTVEDKVIGLW